MEGAGFRSLIVFLLLAVLAFVAGSLASENAVGALAPTAVILGLFFLIYLGKNCWILVFLVPPVLSTIDLSILRGFPVAYMVCGVVLVYMLLLSMMGYLKLKWNYVPIIDYFTLVFILYFLSTYIRHPVQVGAFTSITDFGYSDIGGKEYIWGIGAVFAYLSLSVVPVKIETLIRIMKWTFWLSFVVVCIMCVKGLITGNVVIGEEVVNSRFGAFAGVGGQIFNYIFAKYPFCGIILSPWKLLLVTSSIAAIALSGFRSAFIGCMMFVFAASVVYRQAIFLILLGGAVWGSFIYLSHENKDFFDDWPHGVKRVLTVLPGVEINDRKVEQDAQHSSEWRLEMWRWAFDPSKGYIKDYVWGDGFGFSQIGEQQRRVSVSLGLANSGDNRFFAEIGVWHNGAIVAIHRTGFVGFFIALSWMLILSVFSIKLCKSLVHYKNKEYLYIGLLPSSYFFVSWLFFPVDYTGVVGLCYIAAYFKTVYVGLLEANPNDRLFRKKMYMPLILRLD